MMGTSPETGRRYELLLAGLDLLDQGVAIFDSEPRLIAWNQAFTRLLDLPQAFAREGTPFETFVRFNATRGEYGEGDVEDIIRRRMAAVQVFQPHVTERVRPNGQILRIQGVPIPNLGFISVWSDITAERRRALSIEEQNSLLEQHVQERTAELLRARNEQAATAEALYRSEMRLLRIMDSLPAMIAYVGADEVYRFVNQRYAEWFGVEKEALLGRAIPEVLGAESYAQIASSFAVAHLGQEVSYEYSHQTPAGEVVYARSAVVPEQNEQGEVMGFFVLSTDITQQKAQEAALIQAQKMEAIGQLTGGLAHDFNNLLTIMLGNLQALGKRLPDAELRRQYLEPAVVAVERGAELIRRLVSFSRRQKLVSTTLNVGEQVATTLQFIQPSLPPSIRVEFTRPEPPLFVQADAHQLENTLINLAINARDAMPEGGVLGFHVHARKLDRHAELPPGDYVEIQICDTGCGIESGILPRIFEPFFTTKEFGQGSGLGLAMVYGFVRQSGGDTRVDSVPGEGTRVGILLPRCDPPGQEPAFAYPGGALSIQAGNRLVLLVEDELEVRRVIREYLTSLGFSVIEAQDSQEGLVLLKSIPEIALVITDCIMPGSLSGLELAHEATAYRADLPILLMSGYMDRLETHPWPLLRKPFSQQTLAHALHHLQLQAP